MSPLPGAPRGNAPPRAPHGTRPHDARTLGARPHNARPHDARPHDARAHDARPPGPPRHEVRHLVAALLLTVLTLLGGAPAAAGTTLPAPGPGAAHAVTGVAHTDSGVAHAAAPAEHIADPAVGLVPRAGADRPHAPHHVPPPGHGALAPRPQGLPLPRGIAPGAAGTGPFIVVRAGAALPGVRGPPGVTAGQPALRRSCSTDPSPRPPL